MNKDHLPILIVVLEEVTTFTFKNLENKITEIFNKICLSLNAS